MMLHGSQPQSPSSPAAAIQTPTIASTTTNATPSPSNQSSDPVHAGRKRKADSQDNNERLSKRLSLLNLGNDVPSSSPTSALPPRSLTRSPPEQDGPKLYVPVGNPSAEAPRPEISQAHPPRVDNGADDSMQLDDSKHKVYIYNLDDELSSEDESADDGRLVFLPDIEKHLKASRIPPHILASSDGELAGMQMVLYSDPKSLTVSEDKDSVRKAIIETRHRLREKQKQDMDGFVAPGNPMPAQNAIAAAPGAEQVVAIDDPEAMDMD
ncbi:hypothetical protein ACO1O0_003309 [Amphichorda felina]